MIINISSVTLNLVERGSQAKSLPLTALFFPTFCLCLVGIPGTFITICFHAKQIRKGPGATASLLTALAVFDMLSLLTSLIKIGLAANMIFINTVSGGYIFFCHYYVTNYLVRFPKYCSNFLLMIIAIERLYSVVKPTKVKKVFTKTVGWICILTVTVVIPLSLLPRAFEYSCVPYVEEQNQVTSYIFMYSALGNDRSSFKWVYIMTVVFWYSLPLLGVIICNIALSAILLRRAYSKTSVLPFTTFQKREMKLTKLILIVTFVFVICVSPLGIMFPLRGIRNTFFTEAFYGTVIPIAMLLETINYSINSVIYFAGSERFRAFVKDMFCNGKCKSSKVAPISSSSLQNNIVR